MTGRGLSESNLKYLGNKLFGTSGTVDFTGAMVTWAQFNKVQNICPVFSFPYFLTIYCESYSAKTGGL